MISKGVKIEACKCSDNFGVSEQLIKLRITVKYMGNTLTDYIKSDEKTITI